MNTPVIEQWSEEERDRAFLLMHVLVKNLEFMANIHALARKPPSESYQQFCNTVLDFTNFLSQTFNGSEGMVKELGAFCAQLGISMEVHHITTPPKGPPN